MHQGQIGKYGNNDESDQLDVPKNLMVIPDRESGSILLFHHDAFLSRKWEKDDDGVHIRGINKFMINLNPRIILLPSISKESGPLLSFTLIRSPAQHILSSSLYFLTTLHSDNRLRLWNTNDGRCLLMSASELFSSPVKCLKRVKQHPGHALAMSDKGDIFIVNVYKMTLVQQLQFDFVGVVQVQIKQKYLSLCDRQGKVFIWKDLSVKNIDKNSNSTLNNILFEGCNNEDQVIFKYELDQIVGGEELSDNYRVLSFCFLNPDLVIVVYSNKIDLSQDRGRKVLYEFNKDLIFAKFFNTQERELLICIDKQFNLYLFDMMKLKREAMSHDPLLVLNLFSNSKFYEEANSKIDDISTLLFDKREIHDTIQSEIISRLKEMSIQQEPLFNYTPSEEILYTVVSSSKNSQMVSWSLSALIENLTYTQDLRKAYLPMFINQVQATPTPINNCLINFNSIIMKNYYNQQQFQFFFSDEAITDQVVYSSLDHPSLIIGTNYGRIFMISLFQESEVRVFPVVLIDSHHLSPIKKMFVTYNSSRRQKRRKTQISHNVGNSDNGGHLISVSEDGTIAVTNLDSMEIQKQIQHFSVNDKDRKRADQCMGEINNNRRSRRRNSIHQTFSFKQYFYLVKTKSQRVFPFAGLEGTIIKILEIKNLKEVFEKLNPEAVNIDEKRRQTEKKAENDILQSNMGSSIANSSSSLLERSNTHNKDQYGRRNSQQLAEILQERSSVSHNSSYACIGSDGGIYVLNISILDAELDRYLTIDGETIGIYDDPVQNLLYVLSDKLNIFIYNKRSHTLVRKGDFRVAINVLRIKDTCDHFLQQNEFMKTSSTHGVFDFNSFTKFFRDKNKLMGFGQHQTLDYLSTSLNFPLNYGPFSLFSSKFSKAVYGLLLSQKDISELSKNPQVKDETLKQVLKAFNESVFTSSDLYKSDFNEDYYRHQNGVINLATQQTFLNSRQQIMIVCTKQFTKVMKLKQQKQSEKYGRDSKQGQFFEEQKHQTRQSNGERRQSKKEPTQMASSNLQPSNNFQNIKWPTRILSLVHPFNLEEILDENLELLFGINLPFLDFRIGIQGAEESFSFVLSKEDEDYHSKNNNAQMMKLLRISQQQKEDKEKMFRIKMPPKQRNMEEFKEQIATEQDHEARFFNSDYWKISSYMSSLIPTFFLSVFVSIVEFAEEDIKLILQDWVLLLQRINLLKITDLSNNTSMSSISSIILKKDHNISSTARDVIMKPLFNIVDKDLLKNTISEWECLILDTLVRFKKDYRPNQNGGNDIHSSISQSNGQQKQVPGQGVAVQPPSHNQQFNKRLIGKYLGELEIRGLINLSYYSLYFQDKLNQSTQKKISSIITNLIGEIVRKFNENPDYIHLLTILLQLLSTWMKSQNLSHKNQEFKSKNIKMLLKIYNFSKSPLNKDSVITRINADNFHLIRPLHSELYLKLTAAKALLEIGENSTSDFLQIISEQATTMNEGAEYQKNVLEILRYFINGFGENLEHHLIQLTQILLKCLDPNDLALRKNSHKIISVILSLMVKLFPMVAFHHESQRLAVGTHDGPIAIYDVRTSAKWKILEGHTGNVTCLGFDLKGNSLASYSSIDLTVRLWKVGNTGFFSTIMGGTGKCSKEKKLDPLPGVTNPHKMLQMLRQNSQINPNNNEGQNMFNDMEGNATVGREGNKINKCFIKFIPPKEKEVELKREDGKVYPVKLGK